MLRPSRRGSRRCGRIGLRANSRPPLVEHPVELIRRGGRAWRAPACCRSGRAGTARARCRGRGWPAPSGPTRAMRSMRCDRGRRDRREPQPAVAAEALLRCEVVHVGLGRVEAQPARARRRVDEDELVGGRAVGALDREHHAGRGLVLGPAVCVDGRVRRGAGMGSRRAFDDLGVEEVRRGAGDRGELRGELAAHEVLAPGLDESEARGVPERGGAAVAEEDLVAVGESEQFGDPGAYPADDRLHRRLAVAGAQVVAGRSRKRLHRLDPHLRRSGAESTVGRAQFRGKDDGGRGRRSPAEITRRPWSEPE